MKRQKARAIIPFLPGCEFEKLAKKARQAQTRARAPGEGEGKTEMQKKARWVCARSSGDQGPQCQAYEAVECLSQASRQRQQAGAQR